MENDDFQSLSKINKIKYKQINIKFIKILSIICFFFMTIIIVLIKKVVKLKRYLNTNKKYLTDFYENKLNNVIKYYTEMLTLYKDNLTEFYIKGRQYIMKINGKFYNDSNIITIQDKLNWLIIHENPENKTNIVDKILLHEYSQKILGEDICVPIIKIYNNTDDINFNELPEKFVLKCNHGSGMNIICNNKSNLNITKTRYLLNKWVNSNFGFEHFEYQYINIKRKIFAEKYLSDDIIDYKIYCFHGKPKFIRVQKKLINQKGKLNNYYNLDWSLNEIETGLGPYFPRRPDIIIKKPKKLNVMINYAKKLSSYFAFVRVDLYEIEDKVYLGELTFTPSNMNFNNKDYNQSLYLGNMLDIRKVNF